MKVCQVCGKPLKMLNMRAGKYCTSCYTQKMDGIRAERDSAEQALITDAETKLQAVSRVILTTETAHNLPVTERLGIVTAEYVVGMHVFRDVASLFRDVFGGRSQTMQRGLKEAREAALAELRLEAHQLGADAVVGVDLDYSEISGGGKSMLFLVASGTAVKLA